MYNPPDNFPGDLKIPASLRARKGSLRGEHQRRGEKGGHHQGVGVEGYLWCPSVGPMNTWLDEFNMQQFTW